MKKGSQQRMKVPMMMPRVLTVLRSRASAIFRLVSVAFSCLFSNSGTVLGALGSGRLPLKLLCTSIISRDSPSSACFTAPLTFGSGCGSTLLFHDLPCASRGVFRWNIAGDKAKQESDTFCFSVLRTVRLIRNLAALKMRPYKTSMSVRGM